MHHVKQEGASESKARKMMTQPVNKVPCYYRTSFSKWRKTRELLHSVAMQLQRDQISGRLLEENRRLGNRAVACG